MSFLEIENLQKRFARTTAVEQVQLEVTRGEFVSFLGPSGCGKTTTLRIIAGFESPSSGAIRLQVLLLDEPLSALDAKIRVSLRLEIRSIQRELGITTIYVTHDQEEALSLSDRIVVMSEGRVEQIGSPFEIYNFPRTSFVASFVGTLNVLRGRVADPARGAIVIDDQEIVASRGLEHARVGDAYSVAIRPEIVSLGEAAGDGNRMQGTVEDVNFLGSIVRIRVRFKDNAISLDTFNNPRLILPQRGQALTVSFPREAVLALETPSST